MNESQRRVGFDFLLGRADHAALVASFGFDLATQPERVVALLDEAVHATLADDVELALVLVNRFVREVDLVPRMVHLLALPWHHRHEDVIRWLQQARDPRAVEALFEASHVEHGYLAYDEEYGLARKCTWALADIGTREALSKLQNLALSGNPMIAGYAQKRLDRWDAEAHRKGPTGTPGRPARPGSGG
jgi:hypothetical protein